MENSIELVKISGIVGLLLIVLSLSACSQADTHPGQAGTKRKAIFKQFLSTIEPLGKVVQGRQPYDQAEFLQQAMMLQSLSTQPWKYFTPDSNYSPTRAKPDVWDKPAEFRLAQQNFIAATNKFVSAAQTGNLDVIRPALSSVEQSCKACHQQFRGIPH